MLALLKRRRLLLTLLVTSTLVAAAATKVNTRGDLVVAAATTNVMIDYPDASIVDRRAYFSDVSSIEERAILYGRLMTTTPVLDDIGRFAGLPPDEISGVARITQGEPHSLLQISAEERANQIQVSTAPYRLEFQASPIEPVLTIYTKTPSLSTALRLANASVRGLREYLHNLALQEHFPVTELPRLRQLGPAQGSISHHSAKLLIAALTFFTAFVLTFVALFLILRRPWRRDDPELPAPSGRWRPMSARAAADWPRTTRVLPWSLAVFIAMIWLTPFDRIQLAASGPVNVTLDRIALPIVALIWLCARAAGVAARPRIRITRVHVALGVFVACALLSVVLDAPYLNHTGDFMLSIKKLPLLVTYVSIFLIFASSVRRTEVRAFMNYTLVLAVICGLGVIYEYRFQENVFITWIQHLVHSPFELTTAANGADVLDSLGRAWIAGPTGYGVELVAMMAMVLPIPILGILGTKSRQRQALYVFALAVLIAAMFATERKSSLVLPAAVILMLAYFRRRELIALAPLAVVILVMVALISPGAIHGVISQYTAPDSTHVATTSDRTADYDAVRPDLWSHLLFGRGYGSYDPHTYRILDSEILGSVVETGVFGLISYLMVAVSLILFARKPAGDRDPEKTTPATVGVAAALTLLVASILYDFLGFPHGAFTFLYMAGLAVAAIRPGAHGFKPAPVRRGHAGRGHTPARRSLSATGPVARATVERGST